MKFVILLLNIFYILIVSAQYTMPRNPPPNINLNMFPIIPPNKPFTINGNSPSGPYFTPKIQPLPPSGIRAGVEAVKPLYTSPSGNSRLDAFGTYRQDFNINHGNLQSANPYGGLGLRWHF